MLVVGLTGGIGSGKTTVADLFAKHHVPIIDTDKIARQVTEPDQPAFMDIIDHFEEHLLLENGTLDRAKLREVIFNNEDQRVWLEELLHPLILKEMQRQIAKLTSPYCIAVIPLLFEASAYESINRTLVIDTPEHLQIERVGARDKASSIQVQAIIDSQIKRQDRLAKADDIIVNDGAMDHLVPQVEKLHKMYLALASSRSP